MADETTTTTTDGAPSAAASAASTTEPSPAVESDYLARARANPAWGAEQMRASQSRADTAESGEAKANKALEAVGARTREYVEQVGGDRVGDVLNNYAALLTAPGIGDAIREYERTGQFPKSTGSESNADDDEYLTPEDEKISALTTEVASLRQSVGEQTRTSAKETLGRHMQKVVSDWGLVGDDREVALKSANDQFATWERMPNGGGLPGMKAVMSPTGYNAVKSMMLANIEPEALQRAAANADLRKKQGLSRLDSGGPSEVASTGREMEPVHETPQDAYDWAVQNPDLNTAR